ncbi:MAG TPA: DUF4160 domain-containing protein [Rhizomicrobium sp.]|jgi:hypothetical protein|nr:DUF4160 domain-containing protein [Rhizomicrobium sp.]
MPTISYFYGIAIRMYFGDHSPPHFHAIYGADEALIDIETGQVIVGHLPKAALRLIHDWRIARQADLRENWNRAQRLEPLERLPGLDDE